jgi:hypothetical protein
VDGSNRGYFRVVEQDRNAVGHPDTNNQPGTAGPQAVSLIRRLRTQRELLGQLDPMNLGAVDLAPNLDHRRNDYTPTSEPTHGKCVVSPGGALGKKLDHSQRG